MSRDIKFRAWDGEKMILESRRDEYDDYYTLDLDGTFYGHTRTGDEYFHYDKDEDNKKDYILMQSTGLKDKAGEEIYEGDILISFDLMIEIIYLSNAFVGKYHGVQKDLWSPLENKNYLQWEKVGNIYEHPHLLT